MKHRWLVLAVGLVALPLALTQSTFGYYHPTLGRWLSRDPIGYEDGMGLYEYVLSAPVDLVDPYGFKTEDIGVVVRRDTSWPGHTWIAYPGDNPETEAIETESEVGYPYGRHGHPADAEWKALLDQDPQRSLKAGSAKGKTCDCVSKQEVYDCLMKVRKAPRWDDALFDLTYHNCRDFVRDALKRCCLVEPGEMAWDVDLILKWVPSSWGKSLKGAEKEEEKTEKGKSPEKVEKKGNKKEGKKPKDLEEPKTPAKKEAKGKED